MLIFLTCNLFLCKAEFPASLLITHFSYSITYSQVHKYWDIDTILTFLALYTTTMDFK